MAERKKYYADFQSVKTGITGYLIIDMIITLAAFTILGIGLPYIFDQTLPWEMIAVK